MIGGSRRNDRRGDDESVVWLDRGGHPRLRSGRRGSGFGRIAGYALAAGISAVLAVVTYEMWPRTGGDVVVQTVAPAAPPATPTEATAPTALAPHEIDGKTADRIEARVDPAPTFGCPAQFGAAREARYRAGLVREPEEGEDLPAIRLGEALWTCSVVQTDGGAAAPMLQLEIGLGTESETPRATLVVTRDATGTALFVDGSLAPLATAFEVERFTLLGAMLRTRDSVLISESAPAEQLGPDRVRVAFPVLPGGVDLARAVWIDLRLADGEGAPHTLTLQLGSEARRILGAVVAGG